MPHQTAFSYRGWRIRPRWSDTELAYLWYATRANRSRSVGPFTSDRAAINFVDREIAKNHGRDTDATAEH